MKLNKKILGLLLATTVVSLNAATDDKPAGKVDDLFADPVIAKGKGVEIKQSRLDEAVASVKAGATSRGEEITPAQMPMLQKQVFDNLLMNQLLLAKATDADKAKGKEEGDKRFEMIKKRATSEEILSKQLKALGLTLDTLHARLIEEAIPAAVMRAKVTITDDQVKKYYEDHPADFEEPEMVRASHILILTTDPKSGAALSEDQTKAKRKQIEDLLKRAKAGEDFAKLAKDYSEDPGSKDKGGEYVFPRGQMQLPFESAAFSLKTNQISDVVTTSYGYHIIKLSEKIPAKKVELTKVSPDLKEFLAGQEIKKMGPDVYASLRKEANVEILDPKMKALLELDVPASSTPTTPTRTVPK